MAGEIFADAAFWGRAALHSDGGSAGTLPERRRLARYSDSNLRRVFEPDAGHRESGVQAVRQAEAESSELDLPGFGDQIAAPTMVCHFFHEFESGLLIDTACGSELTLCP